ncbi:MAG TPA: hypothetical protein VKB89_24325 [Xanthobacteraceae bacterium]|nr:hypothetical protein [Xanthobacteraceae bacterium]
MALALEIFQTLGALTAFGTGAFTIYDRLLRYRPFVSIYADLQGSTAWPYLRVTNAAPFDIFVSEIEIEPQLIALSQQTTVRAMVDVLARAKITATIKAGEDAIFHIIEAPSGTDAQKRTADLIKIKVRWYRSLSHGVRPIASAIYTSLDDIEERKRAAVRAGRQA